MSSTSGPQNVLNLNIGVLGHVDSGKTSLVKALSTALSTAALDKHPESRKRGITLDLGFSAFTLEDVPPQLQPADAGAGEAAAAPYDAVQFTLVDCPGHASLIRTIIGGAQIVDIMLLVIDANKGIQTQTAECVVIGEITTDNAIIVLNKIDTIPADERDDRLERVQRRVRAQLRASHSKLAEAPMVCVAAAVGGEKVAAVGALAHGAAKGQVLAEGDLAEV